MRNIGLQLYTVRETLKRDFIGTLKAVAAIGYRGVELAGYSGGHSARELRAILDDLGLRVIGMHCPIEAIANNDTLDRLLEDSLMLGAGYIGVAWLPNHYRSEAGWRRAARLMNEAATVAFKQGVTFFYHNHDFEFAPVNGHCGYDILFFESHSSPLLKAELDVYWVKKAGQDPIAYLRKLEQRVPLIHVKDMSASLDATFEIVGDGIIDFDAVFAVGDASGVDWYIVEQDQCPKGELESARRSYENILARGWG